MNTLYNNQQIKLWLRALLAIVAIAIYGPVQADDFNKYVGESFYLPFPKLSLSNAAIYDYNYEPTTHIDILNQSYGEAKISSYFTGSEYVTCNIYYYIQSPSGYRLYDHTTQTHRVTCRSNNITLSTPKSEINVNEGVQLKYSFDNSYYASNPRITYSVTSASPSGCVSVSSSGYVIGKSSGTATIQATSNLSSNTSSVTIRVRKIDPTSVTITPNPASLYCDATLPMKAVVNPSGASQNVTWSLDKGNSSTASINSYNGVVTGYMPGEITVKATAENGIYSLRTITVKEPPFTREGSIPSNNAAGQNVFITPSVSFSHTLYKGENFSSITLKSTSGDNINGTVKMSDKTIVFTPTKPLSANTKYTLTIPANSVKNKWGTNYSNAAVVTFTTGNLEKLTLSASPSNRFVKEGTDVKLTASKTNAAIYYTLDGTTPTDKSTRYTTAITINTDVELKAVAILEGYENSTILQNNYLISNVAVINVFPSNENPLYKYSNVIPSVTYSNKIEASANADKIILQQVGAGELEKRIIVCDSAIYIVPTEPLDLGNIYKITIPANAIKTWQGEYNEATSWSFATGDFVKRISAGGAELGMALKSDNSLLVWGSRYANGSNENGSYEYDVIKYPTKFLSDVLEISSGYMHYAAIKTDGSLWMWGRQYCGEFGNNSTTASMQPTKVLANGVINVSTGGQTTAIIKTDNTLWMSGRNDFGQIGNGSTDVVKSFTKILDDVALAVAGWGVSYAITNDGQLYGWGHNDRFQLLNDSVAYDATPKVIMEDVAFVAASATESKYFAAIRRNGDLVIWGNNIMTPQVVDQHVTSVSVGKDYIEYIKEDGTLWAFGANNYGQLGDGTSNETMSPVKIMNGTTTVQASNETTFVLRDNGSVYSWGRDRNCLLGQANNYSEISFQPSKIIDGMPMNELEGISGSKTRLILEPETYGVIPVYPFPLTANYKKISWNSSNSTCATVDENGVIYAVSEGESEITATISDNQNNSFKNKCLLIVVNPTVVPMPTASIAAGSSVYRGTEISLNVEGDGLKIWYTTDRSCPCDENGTRQVYSAPITITGDMVIKAMTETTEGDVSDVATFTYSILRNNDGVALNNGWTWASFNVKSDALANVNTALASGTWATNDEIKNDRYTDSYSTNQRKWIGTLSKHGKLDNTGMFKIHSSQAQTLQLTGEAVNPQSVSITVNPNWNYIAYLPMRNLSVTEALVGYDAQEGDVIKSQDAFAVYSARTGWQGDLTTMIVGQGYMLKRSASAAKTVFRYPEGSTGSRAKKRQGQTHLYANNMNVIGRVVDVDTEKGDSLIAMVNGMVRGASVVQEHGKVFLTIQGDETENVELVLQRDGEQIAVANAPIRYENNDILGTLNVPTDIKFAAVAQDAEGITVSPCIVETSMIVSVNRKDVKSVLVAINSISGALVAEAHLSDLSDGKFEKTFNLSSLSAGVYLVTIRVNGQSNVVRIIKK